MRLRCEYKTDKIPVAYQMMFVSLIKEALRASDQDYYEKLYKYKHVSNKQSKNFTFAVYVKDYDIAGEVFYIKDKVVFNISSPDLEFIIKLYNGLLKVKRFEYKEYLLNRIRIDLVREKEITSSEVVFKTLSPICIKSKNNKYLRLEDKFYVDELNYIADIALCNYRGQGLRKKLRFVPINMRKTVVKEEIRDYEINTGNKYIFVHAYTGIFKLIGDVEDLKDLYALGISFMRNQGFGMVEVV